MAGSLRSAGYTPEEVDLVLVTHLHSDHIGGLTTHDGKRVYPNAEVYVAKEDSDFWLSPEIAAKAPKDEQPFFQSAQAIAAPYIKAGRWHAFSSSESIVDGMQLVPLHGHTPGQTGYEFSSKGQKILFWGDTIHAQRVQLQHPEVTVVFDIAPAAAAAIRSQLLAELAREDIVIAGPHMLFPSLGRLLARAQGADKVISTAGSAAKAAKARKLGFEDVVDLTTEGLAQGVRRITGGKGVDIVIESVGGTVTGEALSSLGLGEAVEALRHLIEDRPFGKVVLAG